MPPHENIYKWRKPLQHWWTDRPNMEQRLAIYFNTYVQLTDRDYSIKRLIKEALSLILCHLASLYIFEQVNHFITKDRMCQMIDDSSLTILCINCYFLERSHDPNYGSKVLLMEGGQHFVLPRSMIFNLLKMSSLWCTVCRIKNFEWYTISDYTDCS